MLTFLTILNVIAALVLVVAIGFHPDGGKLGENISPYASDPKTASAQRSNLFNEYDKFIGVLVFLFFVSVIGINYYTVYKETGEVDVQKIIERQEFKKQQEAAPPDPVGAGGSAPIAE